MSNVQDCPNCGSSSVQIVIPEAAPAFVVCNADGYTGPKEDTEALAIAGWNALPPYEAPEAIEA